MWESTVIFTAPEVNSHGCFLLPVGTDSVMVSTWTKVISRNSVMTHTEHRQNHGPFQVSVCRECLSLALVLESSRDDTCVWHDWVDDVLRLVAELKEEEAEDYQGV